MWSGLFMLFAVSFIFIAMWRSMGPDQILITALIAVVAVVVLKLLDRSAPPPP